MPWWGWLILSANIILIFYIARRRATQVIENMKHRAPDNGEYAFAVVIGLINGLLWPCFLVGVLFIFIFFPSKALGFLEPFIPEFFFSDEEEEEDKTDEEVRKEIDKLRREYTMPKWKRFVLRLIRV